jgi:hypothetical protein
MNNVATLRPVNSELQKLVDEPATQLPVTLAHVLTPIELGKVWVVHPTDNDPVLVSEHFGAVAIWFNF